MEKGAVNQFLPRNSGENSTWFSPDWFGTGGEKTQEASVSHTALCPSCAWLWTAFVQDRGQAEGRKDAGCLAQPHYFVNDTLLKHNLIFFSLGELVKSLIYFLVNPWGWVGWCQLPRAIWAFACMGDTGWFSERSEDLIPKCGNYHKEMRPCNGPKDEILLK